MGKLIDHARRRSGALRKAPQKRSFRPDRGIIIVTGFDLPGTGINETAGRKEDPLMKMKNTAIIAIATATQSKLTRLALMALALFVATGCDRHH